MEEHHEFGQWSPRSEDLMKTQFPLHLACRDGDLESLTKILESGKTDFYEEDDFYGWTPIHWAAYFGKLTCLMRLLEKGSNHDNTTERFNQTPVHLAAYNGKGHCLKWLLHCGALKNRQDYLGETPVHKAARTGSMECVSLLVSQGCKLSIKNYNGQSPSQLAVDCGFHECGNYLERALQMQQQATQVYSEFRTPANQQPSTTTSLETGSQGNTSQSVHKCVIMQGLNGGLIPNAPDSPVGVQHGLSYFDDNDCDMDTETSPVTSMQSGAGVKRSLDDGSEMCLKKRKTVDYGAETPTKTDLPPVNGFHGNNNDSFINNNNFVGSSSVVEHYNSVAMQQGYDSMVIENMLKNDHGS